VLIAAVYVDQWRRTAARGASLEIIWLIRLRSSMKVSPVFSVDGIDPGTTFGLDRAGVAGDRTVYKIIIEC
jgi:hypothetical protein